MTNKEMSAAIRKELKDNGFKGVSVSVKDCGYDTAIRVKIKNPNINRLEVEKLLNHWEEIDRDERTGEILSGCNAYLFLEYQDGIFDEVAQEWAATAMGAMKSKDETTRIFDGLYLINWEHSGRLELKQQDEKDHCTRCVYDFNALCVFLYKFAKFGTIAA